jgi:hypothetical protein
MGIEKEYKSNSRNSGGRSREGSKLEEDYEEHK